MMQRREFLLTSASALGARAMGANDRIRVAMLGIGWRGMVLTKEAAALAGVEVAGVCDPDRDRLAAGAAAVEKVTGQKPRMETDLRRFLDDSTIDAVVVVTPNHWHCVSGVWACQAGKHVYMEKPVSHTLSEGRKLVEASRKYNRIMQGGTQRRSNGRIRKAVDLLHQGVIGDIYMARAIVFGVRDSIGFKPVEPPPANLEWDLWLGPARTQPFHRNLVHYNWHWFWDFGNGELGNNGSHQLDVARWGLNKGLPTSVHSTGGRLGYKDQGETPNTQVVSYKYADGTILTCETRGLYTNDEGGVRWGVHFYGSKGYLSMDPRGDFQIFMGRGKTPVPDPGKYDEINHFGNFFDAVRAGKRELQTADIEQTHLSNSLCHLGNISYRLGRSVTFDPAAERFTNDEEANGRLQYEYRKPYAVPEKV